MASIPSEGALISALVRGDRAAFAGLFQQHNAAMIRVAAGICASRAVAEEVAQEAWLAVLQDIGGFGG